MSTDAPALPPDRGAEHDDARPLVGRPVNNRGIWFFAGGLALFAILLFSVLEARRTTRGDITSPSAVEGPGALITAPPSLAIPGGIPTAADAYGNPTTVPQAPVVPPNGLQFYPPPPRVQGPRSIPGPPIARNPPIYDPDSPVIPPQPQRNTPLAPVTPETNLTPTEPAPATGDRLAGNRVGATRLLNPASTVPQGTVIQAVMETALDSNRPGFARAIVSRDVRSFDGATVLIPRGSRLFGEYKADLADGQNRAFVSWHKLTRPDGVQIALESPAADPLGRAGVKGSVNTHFFQRFGGAVLQSVLDIGVGLATRSATDNNTVVLGLPGSTQQLTQPLQQQIRPTLKVPQGSRVSVFVARDLDFSTTP